MEIVMWFLFLIIITAIEDDYVGPQLEDGKVTLKFMEELMEFYKDQKKLHRKFAYKVRKRTDIWIRKNTSCFIKLNSFLIMYHI